MISTMPLLPFLFPLFPLSALAVVPNNGYTLLTPPLTTDWTYSAGLDPWTRYPRPQMVRQAWQSLNGVWAWKNASGGLEDLANPPTGETLEEAVLVPSCLESALSGVQAPVISAGSVMTTWWQTSFTVPSDWAGQNVILNFGAVDYEATVFINGQNATFHRGGYTRFFVDITQYLTTNGTNELLVFVHDPTDSDGYVIPIGKQSLSPSHVFYTPCTGIWQSVFIEPVPSTYIASVDVSADMNGVVNVTVHTSSSSQSVTAVIHSNTSTTVLGSGTGTSGTPFTFTVPNPSLWSPVSPSLYNLTITMGEDTVEAYTGFRSLAKGSLGNVTRPLLNEEFVFAFGTLDQGFWPDGIYTPPTYEAMLYDLQTLKSLGFNMVRKHVKVEPDLFYRACDELGLLVMQDMPSLQADQLPNATQQAEFESQLSELINTHKSFPSIYTWVIYNEGWGQLSSGPELQLAPWVKSLDPTRLVNAVTGWHDHGAGDYSDNHHYPDPQCGTPFYSSDSSPYDPTRIGFQGEFGGLGNNVSVDHLWNNAAAIATISQTYELDADLSAWNYRSHDLLSELARQVQLYGCSGAVWTQTTDVEGEVNGLMTYDRRILRTNVTQWTEDIQALYAAAATRGGSTATSSSSSNATSSPSSSSPQGSNGSSKTSGAGRSAWSFVEQLWRLDVVSLGLGGMVF